MNEIQRSDGAPGVTTESQLGKETGEKDPETWVGLVWRIVRTAIESNTNLIRVCILICLVGAALWLIASVVKLRPRRLPHGRCWVKSSLSNCNGNCVEIACLANDFIGVRDSKDTAGPVLRFTPDEWHAFLGGGKTGEFDGFRWPSWNPPAVREDRPSAVRTLVSAFNSSTQSSSFRPSGSLLSGSYRRDRQGNRSCRARRGLSPSGSYRRTLSSVLWLDN
jgi:hypothetical protein